MSDELRSIKIQAMKGYVLCYLKWKAEGLDVNGKMITPEITARYEQICKELHRLGVKVHE